MVSERRGRGAIVIACALMMALIGSTVVATAAAASTPSVYPIPGTANIGAIHCTSSANCLAIGTDYHAGQITLPFIDGEISGEDPVGDGNSTLYAMACPTSSDCFAVGTTGEGGSVNPPLDQIGVVVPIINGEAEPAQTVPDVSSLTSISCYPGTTTCVAAGVETISLLTYPYREGALVTLADGAPTGSTQIDTTFDHFTGVACPSKGSCLAIGLGVSGTNSFAAMAAVTSGVPQTTEDLTAFTTTPTTVSCPTAVLCWVAGSDLLMAVNSGTPATPTTLSGADGPGGSICTSATLCYLFGNNTTDGVETGFIMPISGTTPEAPQSVVGTQTVSGLSCIGGQCVATGNTSIQSPSDEREGVLVTNALATPPPTVSSVALSGSGYSTTVTIHGTNFGDWAPAPSPLVPVSCVPDDTSYDYPTGVLSFTDTTGGWSAGTPGACVGLHIKSWSSTQVVVVFGAGYVYPLLQEGDAYTVSVLGTSLSGTATVTPPATPKVSKVSFSGSGATTKVTVTGTNLGTRVPLAQPTAPLTCVAGDTSHTYAFGALSLTDETQGWTAGLPGDCLGLTPTTWTATKVVFGLGAYYPQVSPLIDGDGFTLDILGATYSGVVGSPPPPAVNSVTFSGSGTSLQVTVSGKGFGSSPPTAVPSTPLTCVSGDTSFDYPAGQLQFGDVTDGWTGGETGDCLGLVVVSWTSTKVTFGFGAFYPQLTAVAAGDRYQLSILQTTVSGTVTLPGDRPTRVR